jgi:hypothetical protein
MVHQSKTIVDAAADAGASFIVHLGIFGNGRMTYPYATWPEMVERYIEGCPYRKSQPLASKDESGDGLARCGPAAE